jgi:hypothetical protein
MAALIENVTEELQRHLGIQQAQTVLPEDVAADAVARLVGRRGDVSRLLAIWSDADSERLFDGFRREEHRPALAAFRRVLESGLGVRRSGQGPPKSFRPVKPELVGAQKPGTIYREMGRSVVEGLWRLPLRPDLRDGIRERVLSWADRHPLVRVVSPLLRSVPMEKGSGISNLAAALEGDEQLAGWVTRTVTEDWEAWLLATERLSVDEQVETFTALIGLHLHAALLWRLRDLGTREVPPVYFAIVASREEDPTSNRAAQNCFNFWRDRAEHALREVSRRLIDRVCSEASGLRTALETDDYDLARAWASIEIRRGRRATGRFRDKVLEHIGDREQQGTPPHPGELLDLMVRALYDAFDTPSGPAQKVKDYLRTTGRAADIVGPEGTQRRKRYQIDDRSISLLARLHFERKEGTIRSREEEGRSVEALPDDVFDRYGLVITGERYAVQQRLQDLRRTALQAIETFLPDEQAMDANRARFDRRLDELRLVRRYSDASAVVRIV